MIQVKWIYYTYIITSTGCDLAPEDFVTVVTDATKVKLRYRETPDFNTEGLQPVTIIAEDAAGNQTAAMAQMALYNDSEPPVIKGAVNRTVYVKESISYKAGIEVTDNLDQQPKLTIDNTQVNPDEPGSYPVTYTATDFVGNTNSVTITITVEPTPTGYEYIEKLNAKADRLLAQIIKPEMTEIERAYTIFRWVRLNVEWYAGRTDHNYVDQAIKALDGEPGDCYTCAAVCKVLLERAGFETKFMEREGAPGQHYWVMLKVGGEWYHMDPSPIYVHQFICFLGTDAQLLAFHETRANYYTHDWSKYPATPETSPAQVVVKNGRYTLVVN